MYIIAWLCLLSEQSPMTGSVKLAVVTAKAGLD